jgi:hypothetical protein
MADKDPRDLEHYWHLIEMNRYIEIQDDSSQVHHMPCPFCGAGEWMVYEKSRKKLSLSTGATCKVCKRGARAEFLNIAGTETQDSHYRRQDLRGGCRRQAGIYPR